MHTSKIAASVLFFLLLAGLYVPSNAYSFILQVYQAQQRLTGLGYDPGAIDGLWGRNTQNAVEKFQRDNGLEITGELDSRTAEKLGLEQSGSTAPSYPWKSIGPEASETVEERIAVPSGCKRAEVSANSFGHWLRQLPLKKAGSPVYLYDGRKKGNPHAHFAVIDMDVGRRDLQQCADAVIRLRAEYLYSIGAYDRIHFKFTSGHTASYSKWEEGYRPVVKGNRVDWTRSAKRDASYPNFRKYLDTVFMYAGSHSLSKELVPVDVGDMRIGDVFIAGGFPGHAVIVMDMAVAEGTGKRLFLLAQSYMPAQQIHVLKNPTNRSLSPWYKTDFGQILQTPEWTFQRNQLKRFK